MIKLEVEEMCHECPCYSTEVTATPTSLYAGSERIEIMGDTVIKCKNRQLCKYLRNYLKEAK